MHIHWGLLRWFFRQTWPLNGLVMAVLFVLAFVPDGSPTLELPGTDGPTFIWLAQPLGLVVLLLITVAHPLGLGMLLGRYRKKEFAFLYTRGFSRNAVWGHLMLFSVFSVALVWAPACAALQVSLPEKLYILAGTQGSPYMTFTAILYCATAFPSYPLLIPAVHFAWIRQAQPDRSTEAGFWLGLAVALGLMRLLFSTDHAPEFPAISIIVGLLLLAWSRRLHQRMELRP
jgi:hypothetical protein